jgi:hypothetical protein
MNPEKHQHGWCHRSPRCFANWRREEELVTVRIEVYPGLGTQVK